MKTNEPEIEIMSVVFKNLSKNGYLKIIKHRIAQGLNTVIFTPNPQMLLGAKKDENALYSLRKADINLPDGFGLIIASKILQTPIRERVCGIDFAQELLALAQKEGLSVFLLGSKAGRAQEARENLKKRYPCLKICGTHHGYFNKHGKENMAVVEKIRKAKPDLLFVCFGFPEQEKWVVQNLASLPSVKLAIGLGGSIDVWSGHIKRAPKIFRQLCIEWLWRAVKEPRRLKILFDIPHFFIAVLIDKKTKSAPQKAKRP